VHHAEWSLCILIWLILYVGSGRPSIIVSFVSVRVKNVTGVLMREVMSEGRCISENELSLSLLLECT